MVESASETKNDAELVRKLEAANLDLENDSKAIQHLKGVSLSSSTSSSASSSLVAPQTPPPNGAPLKQKSSLSETSLGATSASEWEAKWTQLLLDASDDSNEIQTQLISLMRQRPDLAPPHQLRPLLWKRLTLYDSTSSQAARRSYPHLLAAPAEPQYERAIQRDICRTFPTHPEFNNNNNNTSSESNNDSNTNAPACNAGGDAVASPPINKTSALQRLMHAYSVADPQLGYCQGSAFVAALLLLQLPSEPDAFSALIHLMQGCQLRNLYLPDMRSLQLALAQLDALLRHSQPSLHQHLEKHALAAPLYASNWFLTLFAGYFPLETACRALDWVMADGLHAVFRLALSQLRVIGPRLLLITELDRLVACMQREGPRLAGESEAELFEWAARHRLNMRVMQRTEQQMKKMWRDEDAKQQKLEQPIRARAATAPATNQQHSNENDADRRRTVITQFKSGAKHEQQDDEDDECEEAEAEEESECGAEEEEKDALCKELAWWKSRAVQLEAHMQFVTSSSAPQQPPPPPLNKSVGERKREQQGGCGVSGGCAQCFATIRNLEQQLERERAKQRRTERELEELRVELEHERRDREKERDRNRREEKQRERGGEPDVREGGDAREREQEAAAFEAEAERQEKRVELGIAKLEAQVDSLIGMAHEEERQEEEKEKSVEQQRGGRDEIDGIPRIISEEEAAVQVEQQEDVEEARVREKWKNLPESLMTQSIGPLSEICLMPDDPMITSIYLPPLQKPEQQKSQQCKQQQPIKEREEMGENDEWDEELNEIEEEQAEL